MRAEAQCPSSNSQAGRATSPFPCLSVLPRPSTGWTMPTRIGEAGLLYAALTQLLICSRSALTETPGITWAPPAPLELTQKLIIIASKFKKREGPPPWPGALPSLFWFLYYDTEHCHFPALQEDKIEEKPCTRHFPGLPHVFTPLRQNYLLLILLAMQCSLTVILFIPGAPSAAERV